MELIQIVDENDTLIGHKPRDQVSATTDYYRIACLWLENSKGEVLLAQRKWTKKNDPGTWGPAAAGTVDQGETYEQNMYKEAQEEIGVSGVTFTPVTKFRRTSPRK